MNKKRKKRSIVSIAALIMSMLLLFGSSSAVPAATDRTQVCVTEDGVVDFAKEDARISLSGYGSTKSFVGKSFCIYQLFAVENAVGMESVNYTFCEESKSALQNVVGVRLGKIPAEVTEYEVIDYIQSLNKHKVDGAGAEQMEEGKESEFRYFVEEVRSELELLDQPVGTVVHVTDMTDQGDLVFKGLAYGYYLIDEISDNQGSHSASSLCMVNTANPDSQIRIKSDYPSVEIKIQEDDEQMQIGNQGWNDMADYEIGQQIPYKVESQISDMNGYSTYYYAWHHVMDPALSFMPDSIKIVIADENREYELTKQEYEVKEQEGEDSFVVVITDLKKIVDKQFPLTDAWEHHTYGQKITLTYTAKANDLAAEKTGIPGMGNQVRLEFSNDPDSDGQEKTGYTPWDWTVCYTYGINGLKVNKQEQVLANAKFSLYLDEACTELIPVKKTEKGYIISSDISDGKKTDEIETVGIVSDSKGTFSIYGLDSGIYYLKETQAPEGYRALEDPIRIRVQAVFSSERNNFIKGDSENQKALLEVKFYAHIKEFLDGILCEQETELKSDINDGMGNLIVVNTIGSKLPASGSAVTLILLGIGLLCLTAAYIRYRKKAIYE